MSGRADDLYLEVDGRVISGWKSCSVTRSVEACPASFSATMSALGRSETSMILPHTKCKVSLGNQAVIAGVIDRFAPGVGKGTEWKTSGRSLCRELVDCSIPIETTQTTTGKIDAIARRVARPWGITVRNESNVTLQDVPYFAITPGDTPWNVIERLSRVSGVLVYDDAPTGNLLIADVGTRTHAGSIQSGRIVQAFDAEFSGDQRYSHYTVLWVTMDHRQDLGVGPNRRVVVEDPELVARGIYRPLVLISEQTVEGQSYAEQRARWECNRRWGRSQAIRVTVDSWYDSAGNLWSPNWLVDVNVPEAFVANKRWLISSVTYTKDEGSGTTADLTLMPREALQPQPLVINRQNADLFQGLGAVR